LKTKLIGDNLKVAWVKFSTLNWTVLSLLKVLHDIHARSHL